MTPELWVWIAGNILVPAIPVVSIFFAQIVAGQKPTVETVLRDGVLFFYAVTVVALLAMDFWRDGLQAEPKADPLLATAVFSTSIVVLIFLSGAYFVTALAHTGRLDHGEKRFNLKPLANWSWRSAGVVAILTLAARMWSGVY